MNYVIHVKLSKDQEINNILRKKGEIMPFTKTAYDVIKPIGKKVKAPEEK